MMMLNIFKYLVIFYYFIIYHLNYPVTILTLQEHIYIISKLDYICKYIFKTLGYFVPNRYYLGSSRYYICIII